MYETPPSAADAFNHQRPDSQSCLCRPPLHRVLCSLHGHRLRPQPLAFRAAPWPASMPGRPVPHIRHIIRLNLHANTHVSRQVLGRSISGTYFYTKQSFIKTMY